MSRQGQERPSKIVRHQETKEQNDLPKYRLSTDISALFTKILKDSPQSYQQLPLETLNQLCAEELKRLLRVKAADKSFKGEYSDNELTVSVVSIQARIMAEGENQANQRQAQPRKSQVSYEPRDNLIIKRYENLIGELEKNEAEIKRFMDSQVMNKDEIDFGNCLQFFSSIVRKLKKLGSQKLISSRIKLLQAIGYLLRQCLRRVQPDNQILAKLDQSKDGGLEWDNNYFLNDTKEEAPPHQSLTYDDVNKWSRYSSRFLEDKLIELSGICEQIPQLQIFNRTLQFSQLESTQKVSFFRVVEVIIALHHRVSYLSRKKPALLKELQNACSEISFINTKIEQFLGQMTIDAQQIIPMNFSGMDERWKSQLSQHFTQLQSHLHKLSDIIIRQDNFHTESFHKTERFIKIVEMFSKVLAGDQEISEEWNDLIHSLQIEKDPQSFSNEEYRLLMILDDCLSLERSRLTNYRQNQPTNRTNQELEIEVNKLIEDYERVKREYTQLTSDFELQQRLKEELLVEVDERDKIIKNLSAKKLSLQKKIAKIQGNSGISSRDNEEDAKKLEHDAQRYLESSLLLKQQLKVSESQREKLLQMVQTEKSQYLKALDSIGKLKSDKQRLSIECEQLHSRIDSLKNQNLRHINRLNKIITDLTNDKSLLEMQIDTAERNNLKLMERLDLNDKKIAEYNKMMMSRLDERDDFTISKIERDTERLKRDLEAAQNQARELEQLNRSLREEVSNLKFKLKESQLKKEDQEQRQQLISDIRSRLQKSQAKNQSLSRALQDIKSHEEDLEEKLRQKNRIVKDLQAKQMNLQAQRGRLSKSLQEKERKCSELERQLQEARRRSQNEARNNRQNISKKQLQLLDKCSMISGIEIKIKMLEEQLAHKTQQTQKVSQELVETKMKQYESTIQTHKLIEIKLQQQNRTLKKDLDEKMQNQLRLNSQIDRLAKEIDRMKAELEKYLRQLTEKEIIIKMERQKNEEQIKKIRELQIKEKVRKEQANTPQQDKIINEVDTPSQFEGNQSNDNLGRSNLRYNNFFNAREYDRLSKEYNDFKKHASLKIENLEANLEQALKNNALLRDKLSNQGRRSSTDSLTQQTIKKELQRAQEQLQALKKENQEKEKALVDLPAQIRALRSELQTMGQRLAQQSQIVASLSLEKKTLEEKMMAAGSTCQTNRSREAQLQQTIQFLEQKNRQIEDNYRQLRGSNERLREQMERESKNMFQHYESQIKKVLNEAEDVKQRLAVEVESLRKQLAAKSTPTQLEKEKEGMLSELKKSIESLIQDKNKLSLENARLVAEKNQLQREKQELVQERSSLLQKYNGVCKQRDLIRNQHDSMRIHLEEETKRAINLQSQIIKTQQDLNRQKQSQEKFNSKYLLAKIKALEDALEAVGAELSDSKTLLSKYQTNCEASPSASTAKRQEEIQRLLRLQGEWRHKEKVYLQELQSMTREINSLKDLTNIGRQSERLIVTSLPQSSRPIKSTYNQTGQQASRSVGLIRVDKFLQGKRRWEGIHFSESLSRWGVPSVVCQEIEEMRTLLIAMSENILLLNQQQIQLQKRVTTCPSLQNLIEFVFRILTIFSQVNPNSLEGSRIRSELDTFSRQYSGGLLFTVLEEYTVHVLQNNAIEEYKNELREKAKELLEIKEKLEELINRQLEQEERIVNRPHQGDILREPGNYVSSVVIPPFRR